MGAFNPYLTLPSDVCDNYDLPAFEVIQDGACYPQRLAQVCGLIILPLKAAHPTDWTTIEGWSEVIDNTDLTMSKGRYLVGIGSFLPDSEVQVNLAQSRDIQIRDRGYTLQFNVLQMTDGHRAFGKLLELNWKEFDVYLETVGGRLIGGALGMRPRFVNAKFPFEGDNSSRERMEISMNFFFLQFPAVIDNPIDFTKSKHFWGDPDAPEIWGDPGAGEGWGWFGT